MKRVHGTGIHDHAPHGDRGVLAGAACGAAIVCVRHHDGARVGIEEDLRRIEPESSGGFEGPYRPVRVDLPWTKAGDEGVPIMVCPVGARVESDYASWLNIGRAVEQHELQALGAPGVDAKVHAALEDGGTERKTPAWADGHRLAPCNARGCGLTPDAAYMVCVIWPPTALR